MDTYAEESRCHFIKLKINIKNKVFKKRIIFCFLLKFKFPPDIQISDLPN